MIPKKLCFNYFCILLIVLICEVCGHEKSSLVFVIDDTGSMYNEIAQVKSEVTKIFDTVQKSKESQIEDFVLVTFNDLDTLYHKSRHEHFKLRAVTTKKNVFENALSSINVFGGDDCPEYSMAGIMEGLERSRPGSTIYVFTDATAKDHKKYEQVKNLAVKKQSKVIFMLTGDCHNKTSEGYEVYQKLADATSGDVFPVGKDHIEKIVVDVIINIQGRRIIINEQQYASGYGNTFNFNIDDKVREPTVTVTGQDPSLTVTGPDGTRAETVIMVEISTLIIIRIVDPRRGVYTAVVGSRSETRVKVAARSEVMFKHGFSTFKASSINDTTTRPLPDVKSYIHIQVTAGSINLQTLSIIDNKGNKVIKNISLTILDEKQKLYVTELEELPTSLFKLAITGSDPETNEVITRVGPPIVPQPRVRTPDKAPEVTIIGSKVDVDYNGDITLTCKVNAHPAPTIVWTTADGTVLKSTSSVSELHATYISYLRVSHVRSAATYYCTASNSVARDTFAKVDVNPRSPFSIISTPGATTSVQYGANTNIVCDIKSSVPITITWFYQKNEKSSEMSEIHTSVKYTISADESSLRIISTDLDQVGQYTCTASLVEEANKAISYTTKVEINDLKAPEITYSDKSVTVMNGQRMLASCKANGIPKPIMTWQLKPKTTNVFTAIPGQAEQVNIPNISYESAGSYKCTATNKLGAQSRTIDVTVHGEPKITNLESNYYGVAGDKVLKIPCEVTGVPEPAITWKRGNKVLTSDTKITVDRNAVFIKNPSEEDSSNFTCEAKNKYGYSMKHFEAHISDFIVCDDCLNSYIYLKPGESTNIKCLLPHSGPQSVRWYVNSEKTLVTGSSYSLQNANFSNDGNYTCRVNTEQGSASLNYVVDVGYEPVFTRSLTSPLVWNGDRRETLDCNVQAKPREKFEWIYNGAPLDSERSELPISGWGAYSCTARNVHGSVQRTFNVTSNVCVIDRTVDGVQNTPLLIEGKTSTWPKLDTENEYLTVSRKQMINLACSTEDQPLNTFKTHPNATAISAECYKEDQFIIKGKTYKFQDLLCKEYVRPSLVVTKKPCMNSGEITEVGYKLNNGFLGVYEVCYSEEYHRTLYTRVVMSNVNMGNIVGPAFALNPGTTTGTQAGDVTKCRYNQRRAVSPVDVAFGPAQIATLSDKYNAIPVLEPCEGSSRESWSVVEGTIRDAMLIKDTFTVWTGASHYNSRGTPRYLWKVGKFEDDVFETIVYVNDPNPDSKDILCSKYAPDVFSDIADTHDPYTYACSMDEFLNAFKLALSDFKF